MAKMPFIADPRYSNGASRQFKAHEQIKAEASVTHLSHDSQKSRLDKRENEIERK